MCNLLNFDFKQAEILGKNIIHVKNIKCTSMENTKLSPKDEKLLILWLVRKNCRKRKFPYNAFLSNFEIWSFVSVILLQKFKIEWRRIFEKKNKINLTFKKFLQWLYWKKSGAVWVFNKLTRPFWQILRLKIWMLYAIWDVFWILNKMSVLKSRKCLCHLWITFRRI